MTTKSTLSIHFARFLSMGLLLGALGIGACGTRRCQEAPTQPFQTFTEQEWRLVESVPKIDSSFSNTNFIIFRFGRNFQGEVYRVENNDRFETPVLFFRYNVDPEAKIIVTRFESQVVSAEDAESASTQDEGDARFVYKLGRELEMTDQGRGIYYRFVPFTGVVDPDSACEF